MGTDQPSQAEIIEKAVARFNKETSHTLAVDPGAGVAVIAGPALNQRFEDPDVMQAIARALDAAHCAGVLKG